MKRAVKMAWMLMTSVALTGSSINMVSFAEETNVLQEETVIMPRTEEEGSGSTGGAEGSGGSTGSTEGSAGGSTGSTEGSAGGSTGSTEGSGGSTGSTEGSGGSTGSTEGSGGSTGSTEGSTGGSTGSTEGSMGGSTGSTEKETNKETNKETEKETNKKPDKETEKETNKKPDKETEKETNKKPGKETEKETNKKPDKETEKETNKKPSKETERETQKESDKPQQSTQAPIIVNGPNKQTEAVITVDVEDVPDPEENPLYAEYLGCGGGWDQLKIVSDENEKAVPYELLQVRNAVIICTQSDPIEIQDETQPEERRSLTLSWAQLTRLVQEKEIEHLVFEMDDAMVTTELSALLTGKMPKIIRLALSQEAAAEELALQDYDAMEEAVLDEEQLKSVFFEVQVIPSVAEDGNSTYDISIWMLWEDQKLDISEMLSDVNVAIDVDGMFSEEEKTDFAMNHAVEWTAEDGSAVRKASALVKMPEALAGTGDAEVETYTVTIKEDSVEVDTEYAQADNMEYHSHSVLMTSFAGCGTYRLF